MNKILVNILGLSLSVSGVVFGQLGTLTLLNPGPRVGDEIEVKVSFVRNDLSYLDSKTKKTKEDSDLISSNRLGTGELKMTQLASDTGWVSIGPLKVSLNNMEYVTNVIKVRIYPALPVSIKDGLWVRVVTHSNEDFLIIEQRISNKWTRKEKADNEVTISHGDSGVTYFEFDDEKFEEMGIDIINSNWKTHSQVVDKTDVFGGGTVSYKQAVYNFRKTDDFKSFKIDKKLFKVYPDNGYTEIAWVK